MEIRHKVSASWGNWKKCSGVLYVRKIPVKLRGEDVQNSGKAIIGVWCRYMVNNEKPRKDRKKWKRDIQNYSGDPI